MSVAKWCWSGAAQQSAGGGRGAVRGGAARGGGGAARGGGSEPSLRRASTMTPSPPFTAWRSSRIACRRMVSMPSGNGGDSPGLDGPAGQTRQILATPLANGHMVETTSLRCANSVDSTSFQYRFEGIHWLLTLSFRHFDMMHIGWMRHRFDIGFDSNLIDSTSFRYRFKYPFLPGANRPVYVKPPTVSYLPV